jgi:RNA polymerase sigma-70 factor (ECF subfamily)
MEAGAPREDRQEVSSDALAAFYNRSFGEVYRYLFRAVLGNKALAEDLTQETFASIVIAITAGRAELQSMPWVIGVARHKLIDHYRRSAGEQRRMALVWTGLGTADVECTDLDDEDPARVVELLRELSPIHRLVLVLRYLDELTVEEVAASIDRSVHATESLLVRARRSLMRSHKEMAS